jgi:hypothetical protein
MKLNNLKLEINGEVISIEEAEIKPEEINKLWSLNSENFKVDLGNRPFTPKEVQELLNAKFNKSGGVEKVKQTTNTSTKRNSNDGRSVVDGTGVMVPREIRNTNLLEFFEGQYSKEEIESMNNKELVDAYDRKKNMVEGDVNKNNVSADDESDTLDISNIISSAKSNNQKEENIDLEKMDVLDIAFIDFHNAVENIYKGLREDLVVREIVLEKFNYDMTLGMRIDNYEEIEDVMDPKEIAQLKEYVYDVLINNINHELFEMEDYSIYIQAQDSNYDMDLQPKSQVLFSILPYDEEI